MADRAGVAENPLRHLGKVGCNYVGSVESLMELFQPVNQPLGRQHGTRAAHA